VSSTVIETVARVMKGLPPGHYGVSDFYALIERAKGSPVKAATVNADASGICLVSRGARWSQLDGLTISPGATIGSHKDYLVYTRERRRRSEDRRREEERRRQERPPSVAPDPPAVLFPPERTPPIYEELWVGEDVLVLRRETGREVLARIIR
jgi:hypothetical protein